MTITRRFLLGSALIVAALYLALDALFPRLFPGAHRSGILLGLGVSAVNVLGSFFLLSWGGRRGDRQFLSSFVIGMLGRLALLGAAAWFAQASGTIDVRATLITLVAAFFPLMGYEVYCVIWQLDRQRAPRAPRAHGAASAAALLVAIVAACGFAGAATATSDEPGHEHESGAAEHAAPAEHAAGDAHAAGDDVFTHLFHHLKDEVVFPLPPVKVGGLAIDLSITKLVIMLWVVVALNVLVFGALARKSRSMLPTGAFHNLFESLVVFVKKDMVEDVMGHHLGHKFTPYFLTVFFFVLFANLLGLVPFMHTATGNIAVTAALALTTLFVMQASGVRENGLGGYLKSFAPPGIPMWLLPIMIPVEILGQLTKPFALTIRLFANMTAGHVVILTFFGLLFVFKNIFIAPAVIGFVLFVSALELLVAFLQAYIFTFLSILFVSACAHPEH